MKEVVVSGAGDRVICERCLVADRPWTRMRGLLGRRDLPAGEGLLLRPGSSIHTFFMRFSIDVVFVDRSLSVVGIRPELAPWRVAAQRGAHSTLELAAGEATKRGVQVGQQLMIAEDS